MLRLEELVSKKKWITAQGFNTNTGGRGNMMGHHEKYSDHHYVATEASSSQAKKAKNILIPRDEDKEQFLFGAFQ